MIALRETVEVNRPVAEVFRYVSAVENAPKWQPAVIEVKRIDDGPIRVGSKFAEAAKMMGRTIRSTCEVVRIEPDKAFAFKGTSDGPFEYETAYTFEPSRTGTTITINGVFRTKGLWRLLEPLMRKEVQKESAQELQTMKAFIESRTT